MTISVHATAVVDVGASLAPDVTVGPYAVVGSAVRVGGGTSIGAHAVLEGETTIGARCTIGVGAVVGAPPQDRKYGGEPTRVEVGDQTVIREYVSIHRGTHHRGVTAVGRRCFLMAYAHVAHDCLLEDDVTLANAVQLAGHVTIEAGAVVGGLTPIHQFVRIGTLAFVGGGSRVPQDIPPFTRAAGNPVRLYGINTLGLTRAGVPVAVRRALKRAYRLLFNSTLTRADALAQVQADYADVPEVLRLVRFVERSDRGVPA